MNNGSRQNAIVRRFAAQAILTGRLPCGVYGNQKQLEAFSEALYATREFDRLLSESENLGEVIKALSVKRAAAARFRREFGARWPA
jgi:hypothetical protein